MNTKYKSHHKKYHSSDDVFDIKVCADQFNNMVSYVEDAIFVIVNMIKSYILLLKTQNKSTCQLQVDSIKVVSLLVPDL